jgi:hypothetical protein
MGVKKGPTFLAWISLASVALFGIHRALSKDTSNALVLFCVGGSITFLSLMEALLRRRSLGLPVVAVLLYAAILVDWFAATI